MLLALLSPVVVLLLLLLLVPWVWLRGMLWSVLPNVMLSPMWGTDMNGTIMCPVLGCEERCIPLGGEPRRDVSDLISVRERK